MMKETTNRFREKIAEIATKLNLECSDYLESDGKLWITFTPVFPLWFQVEINKDEDAAFIYAVAREHGINGDKSDYHDVLSSILAICLRLSGTASVRITKLEMADILPGEIHSIRMIFDRQPPATFINLYNPNYDLITQILEDSRFAASTISQIWNTLGTCVEEDKYDPSGGLPWASEVARKMKIKTNSHNVTYYARQAPTWEYFRIVNRDIFGARGRVRSLRGRVRSLLLTFLVASLSSSSPFGDVGVSLALRQQNYLSAWKRFFITPLLSLGVLEGSIFAWDRRSFVFCSARQASRASCPIC